MPRVPIRVNLFQSKGVVIGSRYRWAKSIGRQFSLIGHRVDGPIAYHETGFHCGKERVSTKEHGPLRLAHSQSQSQYQSENVIPSSSSTPVNALVFPIP